MIFVIGGMGLVGSAIIRYLESNRFQYKIIQRDNKKDFLGKECDILIYANGNAYGYKAEENPYFDFEASVESTALYVHKIKYKRFVLISSAGVYIDEVVMSLKNTKEDRDINEAKLNNYGFHKLLAENYVKHYCNDYLIFRLSSLVGKGLKKNQVYDFIHKDKKVLVSGESSMNFINTDLVAKLIFKILDLEIKNEIFNLASEDSIKIKNLKNILGFDSEYSDSAEKNELSYYVNTKKIMGYATLSKSQDAILDYYNSLKHD